MAAISTLIESFDSALDTTTKWNTIANQAGDSVSTVNGTLQLKLAGAVGGQRVELNAKTSYDLTGSQAVIRLVAPMRTSSDKAGSYTGFQLDFVKDSGSHAAFYLHTNGFFEIVLRQNWNFIYNPAVETAAFSGNTLDAHAWLRIRESGGTIFWDTAPVTASNPPTSGQWVNRGSFAVGTLPITNTTLKLLSESWDAVGAGPATQHARYDGLNTAMTVLPVAGALITTESGIDQFVGGTADNRPSPVPSDWTEKYWRDYSRMNAISLNAGATETQTIADKGEYKAGTAFYRDWSSFGIAGYGHDVFTDPLVPSKLPAEYLIARPLGEIEPIPEIGIRLHARPSTGAGMNAAIATWFPAAVDLANSMATTVWTTGQLTTFTKISARPPFARVTYFIPRTDYNQKTFLAAMWSTEDRNREWPHDTDHSPFEYDDHEFLGNGTGGKASSTSVHIYGSPGYSTPIKNATIGNYNPPGGSFVDQLCGVLTVFGTSDIKTYMNVNGGTWTLVATTTLASIAGAEYDQYHTAFIHDVSAGYPWEGTGGKATTPLSCDIVRVGIFAPNSNPNLIVPATAPPNEVAVAWRGSYGTSGIPAAAAVGTTIADLSFPPGVTSASVITYGGRLAVVGTELRIAGSGLNRADQPVLRFHIQGVAADGSKSIGRLYQTSVTSGGSNGSLAAAESPTRDTMFGSGTVSGAGALAGAMSALETGKDALVITGQVSSAGIFAALEASADKLAGVATVLVAGALQASELGDVFGAAGMLSLSGGMSAVEIAPDGLYCTGTAAQLRLLFPLPPSTDSSKYSVEVEDVAIRTQLEGGYVATRPRHTRPPRLTWTVGYTMIPDADKRALQAFYTQVRGGSYIFDWINDEDGQVYQVRFLEKLSFQYKGIGATKLWDVTFRLEQA